MYFSLLVICSIMMGASTKAQPQARDQAKAINVTGVWAMTVDTPIGGVTEDATFSQEDEILKVTMSGPSPTGTSSGEGTVKGDIIEWVQTISTPMGDYKSTFKGKIAGDKMSGELQRGGESTIVNWTAVRKK
jgi:hypothetical protein